MVNIKHKKCKEKDCQNEPCYGEDGTNERLYCSTCKKDGMVNIKHRKCKTYMCDTLANKNSFYEGMCMYCFANTYPDKVINKNYKTKERSVADFIQNEFQDVDISYDSTVDGGCSKYRPDIRIDMGSHVIIIEVDEHRHTGYETTCENKRMMTISQDVNHRKLVFIRFNPDGYNGIPSCWKINKKGVQSVFHPKDWNLRLEALKESVQFWIENEPEKCLSIVKLFYGDS